MSQFQGFRAIVVNGSTTVRSVYQFEIGAITSGPFIAGEELTWSGGGVGTYLSDDGDNGAIYFYRTVGAEPVAGTLVVTGTTSGASVTLLADLAISFPTFAGNPPRFDDSPLQQAVATTNLLFISGEPPALVGTVTPGVGDSFQLAVAWGGKTHDETTVAADAPGGAVAIVVRDKTPNLGLPLTTTGDKLAADLMAEGFRLADTQIALNAAAILAIGDPRIQVVAAQLTDQGSVIIDEGDDTNFTGLGRQLTDSGGVKLEVEVDVPAQGSWAVLVVGMGQLSEDDPAQTVSGIITGRLCEDIDSGGGYGDAWTELVAKIANGYSATFTNHVLAQFAVLHVQTGPTNGHSHKFTLTAQTDTAAMDMRAQSDAALGIATTSELVALLIPTGSPTDTGPEAWQTLSTFENNWANKPSETTLAYYLDAERQRVYFKGVLYTNGGAATNGEDIVAAGEIGADSQPSEKITLRVGDDLIAVQTDGSITFEGLTAPAPGPSDLNLNGLSFRV